MARKSNHAIEHSKAIAGLERKHYFAQPGAKAADWRGGVKQVFTDRKKRASKRACRGKVRW
jgi:hypothetical protein